MDETEGFDLLGQRISAARNGDAEAAHRLLAEFCASVRQNRERDRDERGRTVEPGRLWARPLIRSIGGVPYHHTAFDERLLDYLAECFEKIGLDESKKSAQMTADRALNLASSQRGRKKSSATRRKQLDTGYTIHEAYKAVTGKKWPPALDKRKSSGPLWDAIRAVADERHISESTAARDYEEWQALFRPRRENGTGT